MKRRGVLVAAGAVVTALLGVAVAAGPLPYVVLEPGPTVDVLDTHDGEPVIAVTGAEVSDSAGKLLLTTIEARTEVRLGDAITSWFDSERALVPRSAVFTGGQSVEQVDRKNIELFASSQADAKAAALRSLGRTASPGLTIEFDAGQIGGPSAGLMFTLGIIDKLTTEDLTSGHVIAGTGTINEAGAVGPIGGLPQKLVASKAAGAELFLVPEGNCAQAVQNAVPGLTMAGVATVDEALTALRTYAAGGAPKPCTAG